MIGAGILLVLSFAVAVGALMAWERYGGFANRGRLILNLIFATVMAAISVLLFWWEYAHKPAPPVIQQPKETPPINNQQQSGQSGGVINNNGPTYNGSGLLRR